MRLLAIDPGPEQSAWLIFHRESQRVVRFDTEHNRLVLERFRTNFSDEVDALAIEMIASYGMAVGADVFEACVWIGRFAQAFHGPHYRVYRKDIKLHLCGNYKAKDANVRQALIDRFGPGREKAIGVKRSPGPLYGVSQHVWSALAVAVTWSDVFAQGATKEIVCGGFSGS